MCDRPLVRWSTGSRWRKSPHRRAQSAPMTSMTNWRSSGNMVRNAILPPPTATAAAGGRAGHGRGWLPGIVPPPRWTLTFRAGVLESLGSGAHVCQARGRAGGVPEQVPRAQDCAGDGDCERTGEGGSESVAPRSASQGRHGSRGGLAGTVFGVASEVGDCVCHWLVVVSPKPISIWVGVAAAKLDR